MSTSILYHGFGVRDYRYLKTQYRGGAIVFHVEKSVDKQRCVDCGSPDVIRKGQVLRVLKTVPVGRRRIFLAVHLHRLRCGGCGSLKLEPLLLSFPKKRWTRALGRHVRELMQYATVEDVARHLGMSWDTVKEIHLWALRQKFGKRRVRHLKYLGVDEIAVRKGQNYMTVVVDLISGAVVWVAEDRTEQSLEPFLKRLKRARADVKAIAMDMWRPYITAALNHYGSQAIVFDRYHIVSAYNRTLDELRRQQFAANSPFHYDVFIGTRFLLLRGEEKLADHKAARAKLDRLLQLNEPLNMAYLLKEELRRLWNCQNRRQAEEYLDNWLSKAWSTNIQLLRNFSKMIAGHRVGILNYFDHPITTGKVEGINNKIKVLKRKAYGFRDMEYFKLRIYALHEARYALVG